MNIISDWRFWLVTVSLIKDFILVLGIILVKFNDLRHLSEDMEENKTELKNINKQLVKIGKAIVKRDAICEERHSKK